MQEPPIIAKRGIFINGINEQWIQCDECSKWMKLRSMENLWNQRIMNEQWIQCDECSKWMKLRSMENLWNQRMCSCSVPKN
ncbi:hypothetical protein P8452_74157 [Trifolium repens]|nr:hypothetical protein P8452_74157 [Trifolium repens]